MAQEPTTEQLKVEGDVVQIRPDERYLLTFKGWPDEESLLHLYHRLNEWWGSDQRFFLIGLRDGTELTLERVEADECS